MLLSLPKIRHVGCIAMLTLGLVTAPAQPTSASASYAQAEALIREHHWDDGLIILQSLLKTTPATPKILNLTGLAYIGKGDPNAAAHAFEAALKLNPDFLPALKNLAIDEVGLGQLASAQRHLQAAETISADDPVINLYLGELFYQQRAFKPASEHLRRAQPLVARDPNALASLVISELSTDDRQHALEDLNPLQQATLYPPMQLPLGLALAEKGLCTQAIPYLAAAATAYPSSPDIRYDLAVCQVAAKQYPQAIETLNTLIDQKQESSEIDNLLAEAYEANHQTQPAVDALRRAIALRPADEDNYLDFASLCMDHKAFDDANKVLIAGLTVHPRSSRLIFERGIFNAMQDHFEQAEQDFQLSADLAPDSNSGYIGLGVTYLETGKSAQAVPVLRKRLLDHPNDANLNYLLGEALLRSGAKPGLPTYMEAQTSLQKATSLDPTLVEPHVSLGTIYLQQEKFQQAVDELEQARRLDPRSKAAYSHLAVAYRRLGQQDKAKEVLLQLKSINDQERTGTRIIVASPAQPEATPPQRSLPPGTN